MIARGISGRESPGVKYPDPGEPGLLHPHRGLVPPQATTRFMSKLKNSASDSGFISDLLRCRWPYGLHVEWQGGAGHVLSMVVVLCLVRM